MSSCPRDYKIVDCLLMWHQCLGMLQIWLWWKLGRCYNLSTIWTSLWWNLYQCICLCDNDVTSMSWYVTNMVVMKAQGILISGMSFSIVKIMSQHTLGILISMSPLIAWEYVEYHGDHIQLVYLCLPNVKQQRPQNSVSFLKQSTNIKYKCSFRINGGKVRYFDKSTISKYFL